MRVRVAHASLQFSDSDEQHTRDINKIFNRAVDRRVAWITGTEAGPGAGNTGRELIRIAREHGYRPWVPQHQGKGISQHSGSWLAVRKDLIDGDWKRGYRNVIPGSNQLEDEMDLGGKRWGPRGLAHVSFDTTVAGLGSVSVGTAHYLTGGRDPQSPFWDLNKQLAREIGDWAREEGKGRNLCFYQGDQNMLDNRNNERQGDTFFDEPLTSSWDELKKWENTGHGTIDVIASYNRDGRVSALRTNALNDREFRLNTDHFLVEATFKVEPLGR